MNKQSGLALQKLFVGAVALTALGQSLMAQDSADRSSADKAPASAAHKPVPHGRQMRASLAPSDFPITLSAYDKTNPDDDTTATVLQISKVGFGKSKPAALYTKSLENQQISSIVSWENTERTHYGFLVLTTPADGNLYNVLFFLYHDGKLTMPINDVATGYPVFPSIKRSDKTGQIQISFDDGSGDATNDKEKTVVLYTWSDANRRFVKNVHEVAAESVERSRSAARAAKAARGAKTTKKKPHKSKVIKTRAADDSSN